jgi:hypothetical protein
MKILSYSENNFFSFLSNLKIKIDDPLKDAKTSENYVKKLIKDVQKINDDIHKEKSSESRGKNTQTPSKKEDTINSLGLTMQPKNGINMAIIKDSKSNGEDLLDPKNLNKNNEVTLLTKNYQNLEELVAYLEENSDKNEQNDLKLAKINRLRVLMELSMSMIGRKYKDINTDERKRLEEKADRFRTIYPLPGEEIPLYELNDETGKKQLRLPIKIVKEDGAAKIDINQKFRIDPNDFLALYANKLIDHAQDSTGLKVNLLFSS